MSSIFHHRLHHQSVFTLTSPPLSMSPLSHKCSLLMVSNTTTTSVAILTSKLAPPFHQNERRVCMIRHHCCHHHLTFLRHHFCLSLGPSPLPPPSPPILMLSFLFFFYLSDALSISPFCPSLLSPTHSLSCFLISFSPPHTTCLTHPQLPWPDLPT